MKKLQDTINYHFKDIELLNRAMTHSSYANENHSSGIQSNERLEFLGDSVLSVITAEYLYEHYKKRPEGELTKLRSALVCEKTLNEFALKIGLGEYLILGKGEEHSGARKRASTLSDAFEALIAAIYLDGGIESAKDFVLPFIKNYAPAAEKGKTFKDYKTILQEIAQQNPGEKLEYFIVDEKGPDHNKEFYAQVHLNSNIIGEGCGKSKKEAEQEAAKSALELMGK